MSRALLLCVSLAAVRLVDGLRLAPNNDFADAVAKAEDMLRKDCGDECLQVLHSMLNATEGHSQSSALEALAQAGLQKLEAHDAVSKSVGEDASRYRAAAPSSSRSPPAAGRVGRVGRG